MKLTRRKFLIGGTAVVAVAAVGVPAIPAIPFASGGIIPKSKYTYVYMADIPLCQFGNRMPWISAEIEATGLVKGIGFRKVGEFTDGKVASVKEGFATTGTIKTGLDHDDCWINEIYDESTNDYGKTHVGFHYKGNSVTILEGHANINKVWMDGKESNNYAVVYSDKEPSVELSRTS